MGYFKRVMMDIEEAVGTEVSKGFDSRDEFYEVMNDIAREYNVTLAFVLNIYYNMDVTIET